MTVRLKHHGWGIFCLWTVFVLSGVLSVACVVNSVCYNNADCPGDKVCIIEGASSTGQCKKSCATDEECKSGWHCDRLNRVCKEGDPVTENASDTQEQCTDSHCEPQNEQVLVCPEDMVPVNKSYCIDIYEASRPDATRSSPGSDESAAVSKKGVIPWKVDDNAEAATACDAAGKTLCDVDQWAIACSGPDETYYSYGDDYDPVKCNGIDAFCYCDGDGACSVESGCPFPHCFGECGAASSLVPTGSFPDCTNEFGVYDMNGNVWEHVLGGDDKTVRGGAYNCIDSEKLHKCNYVPTSPPSALGFRCCSTGRLETREVLMDAGGGQS